MWSCHFFAKNLSKHPYCLSDRVTIWTLVILQDLFLPLLPPPSYPLTNSCTLHTHTLHTSWPVIYLQLSEYIRILFLLCLWICCHLCLECSSISVYKLLLILQGSAQVKLPLGIFLWFSLIVKLCFCVCYYSDINRCLWDYIWLNCMKLSF